MAQRSRMRDWQDRIYIAWAVLRGHTVAYKLRIVDGGIQHSDDEYVSLRNISIHGVSTGVHVTRKDEEQ